MRPFQKPGPTRKSVFVPLVLSAFLLSCSDRPGASPAPTPPMADPAADAITVAGLEKELELARGGRFYLVVDPAAGRLRLMLSAVELAAYPMRSLELGRSRVAFVARRSQGWGEPRVFEGGVLEPGRARERREIVVAPGSGPASSEPEPTIPPLPEEDEAPPRFRLVYPGLVAEIVAADAGVTWGGLRVRVAESLRGRWAALRGGPGPLRLRITMTTADAAALYRSLPPDTRLLTPAFLPPAAPGRAATTASTVTPEKRVSRRKPPAGVS